MLYNPESFILLIAGLEVDGFSDGSFIKIKRNKDLYTQKVGAKGDVVDIKSADRTGTLTMSIFSTAASNQTLSGLILADEKAKNGTKNIPILLRDTNGNTAATAFGRIKNWPEIDKGIEEKAYEWVFNLRDLTINIAGSED
jgi:hypothetical protein